MKFLVISQRAKPNEYFKLNDLTGHGRFDVLVRCILAACRPLLENITNSIYCYMKGSDNYEDWGWIHWDEVISNDDEVSLAAKLKGNWDNIFQKGTLADLLSLINCSKLIYLHEEGQDIDQTDTVNDRTLIILGAQSDLSIKDLSIISNYSAIKISEYPMLASQAIVYFRQIAVTMKLLA
ncbi:MAG: hypothetical protein ACW99A_10285 [Candidatus Kariarchaeaceae archaeon]|jgi:tRNA pseudouridine-54 N-methylase